MQKLVLTLFALVMLAMGSTIARAGDSITVDQAIGMGLGAGTVAAVKALSEPVGPLAFVLTIYHWTDGFGGLAKKPVTKSEIEAERAEIDAAANVASYIRKDSDQTTAAVELAEAAHATMYR